MESLLGVTGYQQLTNLKHCYLAGYTLKLHPVDRDTHIMRGISFGIIGRSVQKRIIGTNFTDDVTILHVTILVQRVNCNVVSRRHLGEQLDRLAPRN